LEESMVICAYLDRLDGNPVFGTPACTDELEARRLEALARSIMDGLAVWNREINRPEVERSPTVINHEANRAARMVDLWENEIDHPLMRGTLNMPQITLACALGLEARIPEFRWRPNHQRLSDWFGGISCRPSFVSTAPAMRH
jgi:glutathione S-transferase